MYVAEILLLARLVNNTESGTKDISVDVQNVCSTSLNIIYWIVSHDDGAEIATSNQFFHLLETGTLDEEFV